MKVVLFCGGMGMRMREYSETIPKPMIKIGCRPILWHVMRYYAHYGHTDFILCLGWKGEVIKDYFLNYNECASNDFVMSSGGSKIRLLNSDIHDWKITVVDTGPMSNIGQRLMAVRQHLAGESVFLANYADGLTDLHLPTLIDCLHNKKAIATFMCVKPPQSWHMVNIGDGGIVGKVEAISESNTWMNGGNFVLRQEIFDFIQDGEELVCEPFQRLINRQKLCGYKYDGFWRCMDTFKEKQFLDELYASGKAPWEIWKNSRVAERPRNVTVPESRYLEPLSIR